MFQAARPPLVAAAVDIGESTRHNLPVRLPLVTASVLCLIASGTSWSQTEPGYIERQQRMTELHVLGLVENWLDATGVPGAVVAVVEGGETLMLEGFGLSDIRDTVGVDPNRTVFRVGSLVRAMTATAALRLVEQGALELDGDVSRHPGLEFLTDDSLGPFTLSQLLLDTAGIDQRRIATRARTSADIVALDTYLEDRFPPRIRSPGVVSIPSDHGYALVGRLTELVSGESFESHLESAVLAPLGLSNTALSADALPRDHIATGHRWSAGRLTAVSPDYPQMVPASTLLTTAGDMATWMRAILGGGSLEGRQFLTSRSVERLLEPQFSHHESLPGRTLAFKEGSYLSPRELSLASTENGFSSVMVLLPSRRVGLFAACNGEIDIWDLVYQILDPFDTPSGLDDDTSKDVVTELEKGTSGFWQDAAVSQATAEKLVSLVRQDRIRRAADGALFWRSRTFDPAGTGCFQERRAPARLCFVDGPGQKRFAAIGDLVLERLDWYAARPIQITLWVAFAALFLAAGWPRASLPKRHDALRPDDLYSPRWPDAFARLAATLHFVFIASLAVVLATLVRSGSTILLYEVPAFMLVLLSLPVIAGALTLIAAAGLGLIWRSSRSALGYRLRVTLLIFALLTFLPFLWSWNLLGFRI